RRSEANRAAGWMAGKPAECREPADAHDVSRRRGMPILCPIKWCAGGTSMRTRTSRPTVRDSAQPEGPEMIRTPLIAPERREAGRLGLDSPGRLAYLWHEWLMMLQPQTMVADLLAGVAVALVALPLSLAIADASGVEPADGLVTAIIGGFVVAFFGGCRLQIS